MTRKMRHGKHGMSPLAKFARAVISLLPGKLRRRLLDDPWREHALCLLFMRHRLRLPQISPEALFKGFDQAEIQLSMLPKGTWAAPLVDQIYLLKLVALLRPRNVLELGSFRGYTALGIARQLAEGSRIVAVDIEPTHGEAYRGQPEAARIERRVGTIAPGLFTNDAPGSFDLIFIDADHRYDAVRNDTDTVLPLLSPTGLMVWHDYANWGAFNGACAVPEYLHERAANLPIVHLAGSNLAIYSPAWESAERHILKDALALTSKLNRGGVWQTQISRS